MTSPIITQFVGFVTSLDMEGFMPAWESYCEKLKDSVISVTLCQEKEKRKRGFDYMAKIGWQQNDFDFTFANSQKPGHFSEYKIRAVPIGGYVLAEEKNRHPGLDNETVIIALARGNDTSIYQNLALSLYSSAVIYQAYYENCTYGCISEFTVSENDAEALLQHLTMMHGVEASLYRACLQPQV